MRVPAVGGVCLGATEFLVRDLFSGHRLDNVRPGNIHVAESIHHEHEIGDAGRVHRAARARTENHRYLRYNTGGKRVRAEYPGVPMERKHTLLDASSAGVVYLYEWRACLEGGLLRVRDAVRVHLTERTSQNGKILGRNVGTPPIDKSATADNPVTVESFIFQTEHRSAAAAETLVLGKTVLVEERLQPFAGGKLTLFALLLDFLFPAAELNLGSYSLHVLDRFTISQNTLLP